MSEHEINYLCTDDDDDSFRLKYITRSCRCGMISCTEDTLIVYDHDNEEEFRVDIQGDFKTFMLQLLDGDLEVVNYD